MQIQIEIDDDLGGIQLQDDNGAILKWEDLSPRDKRIVINSLLNFGKMFYKCYIEEFPSEKT